MNSNETQTKTSTDTQERVSYCGDCGRRIGWDGHPYADCGTATTYAPGDTVTVTGEDGRVIAYTPGVGIVVVEAGQQDTLF